MSILCFLNQSTLPITENLQHTQKGYNEGCIEKVGGNFLFLELPHCRTCHLYQVSVHPPMSKQGSNCRNLVHI